MLRVIANQNQGQLRSTLGDRMKPRNVKVRDKHHLAFPGLLPARGGNKALDRAVRNDYKLILLRRMLQRHDDLDALIWCIGWITHNWAMVEQNFEMCISMIYHDLNGKTLVSRKLPLPWNQKVTFLKDSFVKIPEMRKYAAQGVDLVDRADAISDDRNDLVHGVLTKLRPVEKKWVFHIFDYDRSDKTTNWHVLRFFNFGVDEFLKLERKLVPLAGEVGKFGHRLLKDLGND